MTEDRVLRASWWTDKKVQALPAGSKLLLLWLTSIADGDGIAQCLPQDREVTNVDLRDIMPLIEAGYVGTYRAADSVWAWVPSVPRDQPSKGLMKISKNMSLPAPPKALVEEMIRKQTGREPTAREAKQACPRAWGKSHTKSTGIPTSAVRDVWEAWRCRQKNPNACKLGVSAKRMIESALREADKESLIDLIAYAYDSDDAGPRFWRGENATKRTYLGLDNLFVGKKMAGRLQSVEVWKGRERQSPENKTDLGPLARYR
jgi:hypothetical protein